MTTARSFSPQQVRISKSHRVLYGVFWSGPGKASSPSTRSNYPSTSDQYLASTRHFITGLQLWLTSNRVIWPICCACGRSAVGRSRPGGRRWKVPIPASDTALPVWRRCLPFWRNRQGPSQANRKSPRLLHRLVR